MHKLIGIIAFSSFVLASPLSALAADMPVKAPPPPAPALGWTGWYAGLNAGGIWPNSGGVTHSAVAGPCFPGVGGCSPAVPGTDAGSTLAAVSTFNTGLGNGAGFIGGGQFGYNWQFGSGVAGFDSLGRTRIEA